jgi:hypothetical protein
MSDEDPTDMAKITEEDWKKEWPAGYAFKAPDYEEGSHLIETGDVTWHQAGFGMRISDGVPPRFKQGCNKGGN